MKTIEVLLNLASPMHVAYPKNGNGEGINKYSETAKTAIAHKDGIDRVPYYPGNGLRGGLRRCAMRRIVKHLHETEGPIGDSLYLGLACGASNGGLETGKTSIEEVLRARKQVYMGTFGGGMRMHRSAFRVSDMVPVIPLTLDTGLVPQAYKDAQQGVQPGFPWKLLGKRTIHRVDDLIRLSEADFIVHNVDNALEAVTQHQATVITNGKDRKGNKDSDEDENVKKTDVANIMTHEYVAAGVPFFFRLDIDESSTEAQLGMILLCLRDLLLENNFGGMSRFGFGRVQVQQIILRNGEGEGKPINILDANLPELKPALEAIAMMKTNDVKSFFEKLPTKEKASGTSSAQGKQ